MTPISEGVMLSSLIGFALPLGALAVSDWILIARHAASSATR